jgi:polynucleotide adenylyltransferase region
MAVMNIININDTSNKLFYIGGVVRDELLGRKSYDIDITFVGNAIEYCARFGEIIQENPDFGTIRVNVEGKEVDFASTRSESYPRKGHLPVVDKIGCSLKEDVSRRDFTINALAKSVTTGEIIDYTGGLEDLKNKKLRVLHDESFVDDPTRIIRGLKFSVRFGFELDEHTRVLQEKYLSNINYDMSFKRVKKELIETFSLNSQKAFEIFINNGIYKLVTPNEVKLPKVNIEKLVNDYAVELPWIVYAGVLSDLSRLPLTKVEQKILDDVPENILKTDFELYKAFENSRIETVLLYAILKDETGARHYLDELRNIKISVTGKDLQKLGIKPSPKYNEIFDEVLRQKLANPCLTIDDEIAVIADLFA